MQTSTMFLCDTTNVDHARIDETGFIVGGSYRPKFLVEGQVDEIEQVVIDFSTVKKSLKRAIDDLEHGFDHKLWWVEGESLGTIEFENDQVIIDTPYLHIIGPANIVKVVKQGETIIQDYVQHHLDQEYPNVKVRVTTDLTTTFDLPPQMISSTHKFQMVHGLRSSTSVGCQNIGHGHLSYIGAATRDIAATNKILAEIAEKIHNKIFVWDSNLVKDNNIRYYCNRGNMFMKLKDSCVDRTIVLPTETTVENITAWIADTWQSQLKAAGVTMLFVSEGLSKGACAKISK